MHLLLITRTKALYVVRHAFTNNSHVSLHKTRVTELNTSVNVKFNLSSAVGWLEINNIQ